MLGDGVANQTLISTTNFSSTAEILNGQFNNITTTEQQQTEQQYETKRQTTFKQHVQFTFTRHQTIDSLLSTFLNGGLRDRIPSFIVPFFVPSGGDRDFHSFHGDFNAKLNDDQFFAILPSPIGQGIF